MGLISPEGHQDMILIKKIRNKFAHYFEVDGFETPEINGWCFGLKHFENFVLTDAEMQGAPKARKIFGVAGMDAKLKTPKGRYITAIQFYSMIFGPEWPGAYMPPINKITPLYQPPSWLERYWAEFPQCCRSGGRANRSNQRPPQSSRA
jgi:hypothetical protein